MTKHSASLAPIEVLVQQADEQGLRIVSKLTACLQQQITKERQRKRNLEVGNDQRTLISLLVKRKV
jgi:hypothetical protein